MVVASPAYVLRALLIEMGLVATSDEGGQTVPLTEVPGDGLVLAYVSSLPDDMDEAVILCDEKGLIWGRNQRSGKTSEHPGVAIMVRSATNDGFGSGQAIDNAIDQIGPNAVIEVEGLTRYIQSVYKVNSLSFAGEEVGKKRLLWSMSVRMAFADEDPYFQG